MRSVLVAEDNLLLYETISNAFALSTGFAVSHAIDGYAALASLENRPDLALIDLGLPGISGINVARRAVELKVPAVLMSGDVATAPSGGVGLPVIPKPFRVIELVARFDAVVAEAARLNGIMREHMQRSAALAARTGATSQELSTIWAEICKKLER
ncbi:MAG TPA: response regulator [Stellaceae bacterium]